MFIFFSSNSFLCFSFEAENVNHKAAIVTAINIVEKIKIISAAIDVAISFPLADSAYFSNYECYGSIERLAYYRNLTFMNQE